MVVMLVSLNRESWIKIISQLLKRDLTNNTTDVETNKSLSR